MVKPTVVAKALDLASLKPAVLPNSPPGIINLFSPRDGESIRNALKAVLTSARHSVLVNMYGFDDDEIDAIIRAKMLDPNVYVQMSLDSSQAAGLHEKAILAKWPAGSFGTTVAIGQSAKHAISHLKVAVVDGTYMISGSTNWSISGETAQDNQLTITDSAALAAEATAILNINHIEMLRQMGKSGVGHA